MRISPTRKYSSFKLISDIVSGALDRLHYEDDPCVRYDSDKKLWLYLHRDRTLDSKGN